MAKIFETIPYDKVQLGKVIEVSEVQKDGVPHMSLKLDMGSFQTSVWVETAYISDVFNTIVGSDLIGKEFVLTTRQIRLLQPKE